jgi:glycine C-acetyltransferase
MQGLKDFSNVIMCGTGSKCLSTNIGFIGAKDKRIIEMIKRMTDSYENATVINPVQAATSLAQLNILRNQEGKDRRKKVI